MLLGPTAHAQSGDVVQTIAHWNASNATCRNAATPALEAIGACEQRDRFSKLLAQMNQCYGPSAGGTPGWSSCDAAKARTGQDPHPRNDAGGAQDATPNSTRTPAVTYGGALAERNAIAPAGAPDQSAGTNGFASRNSLDIQA